MNEINSLRHETYEAASKFHQAYEKVFACLGRDDMSGTAKAADETLTVGMGYKSALGNLVNHLAAQDNLPQLKEELKRTRQLADTLEKELALIEPCTD
jgi:hypothetical protein